MGRASAILCCWKKEQKKKTDICWLLVVVYTQTPRFHPKKSGVFHSVVYFFMSFSAMFKKAMRTVKKQSPNSKKEKREKKTNNFRHLARSLKRLAG